MDSDVHRGHARALESAPCSGSQFLFLSHAEAELTNSDCGEGLEEGLIRETVFEPSLEGELGVGSGTEGSFRETRRCD